MKKILTIILFCLLATAAHAQLKIYSGSLLISNAKLLEASGVVNYDLYHSPLALNYYLDVTSGNDANTGTSSAFAWKTLSRANSATYAKDDVILLKAGETFYGSLIINRNNITVSSYGSGAKPIITGFVTAASWQSSGNGIWSFVIDRAQANLNLVTMNGVPQQIGRYPNANNVNGGFLPFTAGIGVNKIRGLATTGNVGKNLIIKKNYWREENAIVTAQNGDTITFIKGEQLTDGGSSPQEGAGSGRGYFYYNDSTLLDTLGEWHFDDVTNRFRMYFGGANPNSYTIQVSTVDTGINIGLRSNITISNIHFEGLNTFGVVGQIGSNISITDCDFNDIGAKGIGITASHRVQVLRNTFDWCLENAVCVNSNSGAKNNVVIKDNRATNTALLDGMFCFYHAEDGSAFSGSARDTLWIANNYSQNSAADAYLFAGGGASTSAYGAIIEYNVGDSCEKWIADHGVYYNYDTIRSPFKHRVIRYNWATNGIGNCFGTNSPSSKLASGVYLDGQASNDSVYNNTISGMPRRAIIANEPLDVVIMNNICYNNNTWLLFSKYGVRASPDTMHRDSIHVVVTNNISYGFTGNTAQCYYLDAWLQGKTVRQSVGRVGTIDNNIYNQVNDAKWKIEAYTTPGVGFSYPTLDLIEWQDSTGHDLSSSSVSDYTIGNTMLVTNSTAVAVSQYFSQSWTAVGGAGTFARTMTIPAYTSYILINPQPLSGVTTNTINGIKFIQAP